MPRILSGPIDLMSRPGEGLQQWSHASCRSMTGAPAAAAHTAAQRPAATPATARAAAGHVAATVPKVKNAPSHSARHHRAEQGPDEGRAQRVLEALDHEDMTDVHERAMFMAQMAHESNGFRRLSENLNYRPDRLLALFPKRFSSLQDAQTVVGGGEAAIAERLYGNRPRLGNIHPGDGARYRGRGIVQLTGRANYRAAGHGIGVDLEQHPEMAADFDVAVRVAIWFWREHGIARPARAGDVERVTRIINGGQIGLAERRREYAHWLQRLSSVPPAPPTDGNLLPGRLP